jgi:hypothetical protein
MPLPFDPVPQTMRQRYEDLKVRHDEYFDLEAQFIQDALKASGNTKLGYVWDEHIVFRENPTELEISFSDQAGGASVFIGWDKLDETPAEREARLQRERQAREESERRLRILGLKLEQQQLRSQLQDRVYKESRLIAVSKELADLEKA